MFGKKKRKLDNDSLKNGVGLITYTDPTSPISEQFRTARTNIQFSSLNKEIKSIVFTSSGPSEGKSTVSNNLAVTWAEQGKRVIIVDADLRRPTVHRTFRVSNKIGLSSLLAGAASVNDAIHQTVINNLYVLTSGPVPPNPSELLGSVQMANLLDTLTHNYDIVVVDAPPVNSVTDAQVLSAKTDGTILVVPQNMADKKGVIRAKSLLEAVHTNILGAIMNRADVNETVGYYGGYYGVDKK